MTTICFRYFVQIGTNVRHPYGHFRDVTLQEVIQNMKWFLEENSALYINSGTKAVQIYLQIYNLFTNLFKNSRQKEKSRADILIFKIWEMKGLMQE